MKNIFGNKFISIGMLTIVFCVSHAILSCSNAYAAAPTLHFSDITNGPKTGLGDGIGSGAIITVWGVNLGSSQGTSTVSIGGVPTAHVYYWGNADGSKAAGPADLYTYHKMQTIAFSVPASVADGNVTIKVTVGGVDSNTLPFYVRTGNIKHVKTTGTNQNGCGAWSSPCRSITYVTNTTMGLGDIWYVGDGVVDGFIQLNGGRQWATATNSSAIIAFPNSAVQIGGEGSNFNTYSAYWVFSKLTSKVDSSSETNFVTMKGMRIIANELTQASGYCADGMSGAIWGENWCPSGNTGNMASGVIALGNYIHDYGCDTTSKFQHIFYITPRTGCVADSPEIGWNNLRNNKALHALHVYDEGAGGDFNGTLRIHDNVVFNQVGRCIDVLGGGTTGFHMPVEIFNNLCVNTGLTTSANSSSYSVITWQGSDMHSQVRFYNNTVYGYGVAGDGALFESPTSGNVIGAFSGTAYIYNNIFVDTRNNPWTPGGNVTPTASSHNLWYSTSGVKTPPSWDVSPTTANPLFTAAGSNDFSIQSGSPARDTGIDTSPTVRTDILGVTRPQDSSYDIGAFEYDTGSPPPVTHTITPSAGANGSITPSSPQIVNEGSTMQFNVIPNRGYIANVGGTCGGNLLGTTYTTNAIGADCTVVAVFSLLTHTVTPSAGANGSITPSSPQTVIDASTTQFTVTPDSGYTASVGGTCNGYLSGTTYTTNAITANCTVAVTFILGAKVPSTPAGAGVD